jgi:hypothetical protein
VNEQNLEQLRAEAVEARGLDPAAAAFLTATTLDAIEEQADALARVLGQPEPAGEREQPPEGFFARARFEKQRQREALLAALTGAPEPVDPSADAVRGRPQSQPWERDARGRFVSGSFDGGARKSPPPAPKTHEQTLSELFTSKAADVGRRI